MCATSIPGFMERGQLSGNHARLGPRHAGFEKRHESKQDKPGGWRWRDAQQDGDGHAGGISNSEGSQLNLQPLFQKLLQLCLRISILLLSKTGQTNLALFNLFWLR